MQRTQTLVILDPAGCFGPGREGSPPGLLTWRRSLNSYSPLAGEDVGHYGGSYKCTLGLYKKYGDMRVLDTPICGEGAGGVLVLVLAGGRGGLRRWRGTGVAACSAAQQAAQSQLQHQRLALEAGPGGNRESAE